MTFEETISSWLTDDAFLLDAAVRLDRLLKLQNTMESAVVPADIISQIGDRILKVFGSSTKMVRFRSSSNAEDSLSFSGAGLYDSTCACLANELDSDEGGTSNCDRDKGKERTLQRALTKVWASLWNNKAFEEKQWYGIDHRSVQMAIRVEADTKWPTGHKADSPLSQMDRMEFKKRRDNYEQIPPLYFNDYCIGGALGVRRHRRRKYR